jgi:hypothetical protein
MFKEVQTTVEARRQDLLGYSPIPPQIPSNGAFGRSFQNNMQKHPKNEISNKTG